jgi:hypothetical protein
MIWPKRLQTRRRRRLSLRRTIDGLVRKRFLDAAEPIVATATPQWTNADSGRFLAAAQQAVLWSHDFPDSP